MVKYIEVAQGEIRREKVEAALRMLAYCCSKLKIPAPKIKWFAPVDNPLGFNAVGKFVYDRDIFGLADHEGLIEHGGTIWIRADFPAKETAMVVAHEVLHIMQFYSLPVEYYGIVDREALADGFMQAVVNEDYLNDDQTYLDYLTGKDFSEGRFSSKNKSQALDGQERSSASTGGRRWRKQRAAKIIDDITRQPWFKEAARRQAHAERELEKYGLTYQDVPRSGRRST